MSIKDLISLPAAYLSLAFSANVYATNLFVPAYFEPSSPPTLDYWSGLAAAAQIVPTTVTINPDNGFGTSADPGYVTAIDLIRGAGGKVIAYVHTDYGDRPLIDIAIEIDNYLAFYAIDGFFIDQMAADGTEENILYYEQI
ncbi:spherulation-specific family 4 protein [Nitrosomonas communis]|uniref:Spherulation-specific family 4 n=1 Tax=Nitrosomonas communis TaxID=44574 RepID=A0A1I4UBU0_9PROT|nr:spherulation-specific family 4 protein [Nitrosomonas communis]SFM86300.1 Spherulation-specific family 4 [Nitrosomonas communis]